MVLDGHGMQQFGTLQQIVPQQRSTVHIIRLAGLGSNSHTVLLQGQV